MTRATRYGAMAFCALVLGLEGCGTDDATNAPPLPQSQHQDHAAIPFDCSSGQPVVQGENRDFVAGGVKRAFFVDLPEIAADPAAVPVIFAWHGAGGNASDFRAFVREGVGQNILDEFVLVTPKGLRLTPITSNPARGLEWDLFESEAGDDNLEAALFEEVLGCLDDHVAPIDAARVYTLGFSGGAITSAMLHSRYPKIISAAFIISGAWFNDPEQTATINTLGLPITFSWPALDAADGGLIVQTHGGPDDVYARLGDNEIINFETTAQMAADFLKGQNRRVLDCPHTLGHRANPHVDMASVITLMDSQRAVPGPRADLDAALASACHWL